MVNAADIVAKSGQEAVQKLASRVVSHLTV